MNSLRDEDLSVRTDILKSLEDLPVRSGMNMNEPPHSGWKAQAQAVKWAHKKDMRLPTI